MNPFDVSPGGGLGKTLLRGVGCPLAGAGPTTHEREPARCLPRSTISPSAPWQSGRGFISLLLAMLLGRASAAEDVAGGRSAALADLSLEQLMEIRIEKVVSASRYEQRITEAPAAVTIVTAEEIERFGHRTLAEVLRSVRGLYASDDRNYSYLGVRGFLRPGDYNTRVLMLVDGHRMNDNVYDASYFGRENPLDLDLVERVEVVRGPSSSIHGSSAFFGVINIVTKRGARFQGGVVSAEAGSFDSRKGRVIVGGVTRGGIDWLLAASRYVSRGAKEIYYREFDERVSDHPEATNRGVAENWDGETAETIFSRVAFGDVTVTGFVGRRRKEVPTASFATFFNARQQQTTDQRVYLDAKYDHAFTPELRLLGRAYYDNSRYAGDYPSHPATAGQSVARVLNRDFTYGEWAGSEWQFDARIGRHHRLVAGGEFRANLHQNQINYDLEPWVDLLNLRESSRTLAAYAQIESALHDRLTLNLGVRHDRHFESFGGTTNPRFGVIYAATPHTVLKALYGQAFRAPNSYEQNYYATQRALPALRPERIVTSEVVLEQYLSRHYRFSVSAYHYELKGLIDQTMDGVAGEPVFENLTGARATGAEIELEGRWERGATARVSLARQRAEQRDTGQELSNSPRSLAKFNLLVPLQRGRIFLGYEAQYHGAVTTLTGRRARDFTVSNLSLSLRPAEAWEAVLSAYNVFDTRYGYPGATDHAQDVLLQEGRTMRLKLSYRF